MKYTICGFSQQIAINLGLDCTDLLILKWFVDFKDTGKMRFQKFDNEKYYWIRTRKISEELPILGIQKSAMYRRLQKLCNCQVLKRKKSFYDGQQVYYTIGPNYINLISYQSKYKISKSQSLNSPVPPYSNSQIYHDDFDNEFDDDFNGDFDNDSEEYKEEYLAEYFEEDPNVSSGNPIASDENADVSSGNPIASDGNAGVSKQHPNVSDGNTDVLSGSAGVLEQPPVALESTHIINLSNKTIKNKTIQNNLIKNESVQNNLTQNKSAQNNSITVKPLHDTSKLNKSEENLLGGVCLANMLWTFIKKFNPNLVASQKPNIESWAKDFEFILNEDNLHYNSVLKAIHWVFNFNEDLSSKILNPSDFRKNYETILNQMEVYNQNKAPVTPLPKSFSNQIWSNYDSNNVYRL